MQRWPHEIVKFMMVDARVAAHDGSLIFMKHKLIRLLLRIIILSAAGIVSHFRLQISADKCIYLKILTDILSHSGSIEPIISRSTSDNSFQSSCPVCVMPNGSYHRDSGVSLNFKSPLGCYRNMHFLSATSLA